MTTPTDEQQPPQPPAQIFPSVIRTIVPMIVGWILAQLAIRGLNLPPDTVTQVVTWVITAAYYGLARVLETRFKPVWGWLLGLPKAPTYAPTTPPPAEVPPAPAAPVAPVMSLDVPEPEQHTQYIAPDDPDVVVYADQSAAPLDDDTDLPDPVAPAVTEDPQAGEPA